MLWEEGRDRRVVRRGDGVGVVLGVMVILSIQFIRADRFRRQERNIVVSTLMTTSARFLESTQRSLYMVLCITDRLN